jgi:hypothetical protein
MRALCAVVALGLVLAAPAFAGPAGFNQDPLLVIRFDTFTIAGEKIETQVVIHTSGATEIVDAAEGRTVPVTSRGTASRASFGELQQALAAGRIASERGGCGEPLPDGPVEYHVTWYGRGGDRFNSFRVGANPEGCPARTARIVRAITALLLDVYTSPDTQVFPSGD